MASLVLYQFVNWTICEPSKIVAGVKGARICKNTETSTDFSPVGRGISKARAFARSAEAFSYGCLAEAVVVPYGDL